MLLCNLPEDILAIVLTRCVRIRDKPDRDVKRNLPLLAVCRQWRRLAAPLVYRHVFVQYGDREKRRSGPFTHNPDVEEPTDVAVRTNLDLVALDGCVRAVKRVQIDVHFLVNPFPGWREVIQRMRAVAIKWRVAELRVVIHADPHHFDGRNVDVAKYTDDIAETCDALAVLLPDVAHVEYGGVNNNLLARSLYGRLSSRYAGQLQRLLSYHPIATPLGCRYTGLKKVRINYDHVGDYQPPQMASGELVDLSLENAPANHSWASFSADGDSQDIEFTGLEKLHVSYSNVYEENGIAVRHRDGHPWKLHFPSLKSLEIRSARDICPLLEYAVLPPGMELISIRMMSADFQNFGNLVLPAAKRLCLEMAVRSLSDPSGFPAVNRILEGAHATESLELSIGDFEMVVVPENITCSALTVLQIWGTASVDTMLALIEKLPNLVKLRGSNLDMSEIQSDISLPGADEGAALGPLSLSLKRLAISFFSGGHSPDTAVAVVKCFLCRIPTLTRLIAEKIPRSTVLGFVQEYAPRYPHLSNLKLNYDDDEDPTDCL
ncbi:hypothetical protein H4R21_000347 [Coemansia helicoidea]|uniref:Uncharacterized protein n=1 Tax=Coemansia helicoidea TaxID=1286919 RepID=A0ACC1LFK2_9FUNG|nr:hypothetical protein H4R21_000347 [Coemansia helicoidea]